jgi:hypothetical protein
MFSFCSGYSLKDKLYYFIIGYLTSMGFILWGKGGSTSSSTSIDFFGKGKRKPYEQLLSGLLGIGSGIFGGYDVTIPGSSNQQGEGPSGYNRANSGVVSYDSHTGQYYTKNSIHPGIFGSGKTYLGTSPDGSSGGDGSQKVHVGGMGLADYLKQTPGYQFNFDTGQEAVERSFAASGFGNTGAQTLALQNYGNQYAGSYLQQLISNVVGPSGANMSPGVNSTSTTPAASPLGLIAGTVAGVVANKYLPPSDKKLKNNIKHINTINGIKIYSFKYIWSHITSIGVMAQDLLDMPKYKHAVHTTNIGYVVDYSKLPI